MRHRLARLEQKLQSARPDGLTVALGFDGFVDEIVEVVDRRISFDTYLSMSSMGQFAQRISQAAGLSTNIELAPRTVKLGGNGPIMANALLQFGADVSYMGALGIPNIDPVFAELAKSCTQVFSIAEPGHTDALEFNDGKVMLGKMECLNEVNWANLVQAVGRQRLKQVFSAVDLVAMVNWTMLPHMNEIWEGLLGLLDPGPEPGKPFLFLDLADPGKRDPADLQEAMGIIHRFNKHYRVVLGLNRKEASELAVVRGLRLSKPAAEVGLQEIVMALGGDLDLWCVLVHPTSEAGAVVGGEYFHAQGPYTSAPRLTTGAGDNFNAGFCLGLMLKLGVADALALGTAASGYYVREMQSASWQQLREFVLLWTDRVGEDF